MTKVGEYPIQRTDGAYEAIDLYEPGTFDNDPVLIQATNGAWGTPYLHPLGEGDTGALVQLSSGAWWQLNSTGLLEIDDFERATLDHYFGTGLDAFEIVDETTVTPDAVNGTRMVRKQSTNVDQITSTPEYNLPNLFPTGTTAHTHLWCPNFSHDGTHTLIGSTNDNLDGYSIQIRRSTTQGAHLRLMLYVNAEGTILDIDETVTPPESTWLRIEVDRVDQGTSEDLHVRLFNHETEAQIGAVAATGQTEHYGSRGIAMRTQSGTTTAFWDWWHRRP